MSETSTRGPYDFDDHFVDPFEIVSSCLFIPIGFMTLIIYLRLLKYHLRHGFETHYQKLFFVFVTNDLLSHYALLFRIRLPTWGVHEWYYYIQKGFVPVFLGIAYNFANQFQVVGTLLVAVNRATSLAFPRSYDKFWSRYTWPLCCLCFFVCALYNGPVGIDSSSFNRQSWGYYLPMTIRNSEITKLLKVVYYPLSFGMIVACLFVNLYTCYGLYNHSKHMGRRVSHREMAFHFTTLFQFTVQLVNTGDLIITTTQRIDDFWFFFEFSPVFTDCANLSSIWFLLLISGETRQMVYGKPRDGQGLISRTSGPPMVVMNSPKRTVTRRDNPSISPQPVNKSAH